jgi:hypothetical protein
MRTDRYDKAKSPFRNRSANAAKNVTSEVLYVAMLILCNKESVQLLQSYISLLKEYRSLRLGRQSILY